MEPPISRRQLAAQPISRENFRPYGQLILPTADGRPYDGADAQLNLQQGVPRFYIMSLSHRGRKFSKIARHEKCTQCLGSLGGKDWFLATAPPSGKELPDLEGLRAFHVPGNCFIKLDLGTWHAGPYFAHEAVDFYNLELKDTNISDRCIHDFHQSHNLEFEITF